VLSLLLAWDLRAERWPLGSEETAACRVLCGWHGSCQTLSKPKVVVALVVFVVFLIVVVFMVTVVVAVVVVVALGVSSSWQATAASEGALHQNLSVAFRLGGTLLSLPTSCSVSLASL
jgi:hypothetical protein